MASALYPIFAAARGRLKWRRWFLKNEHQYQGLEDEISEESLTLRSTTERTRAKWDRYSGFVKTENFLSLGGLGRAAG